MEKCRKQYNKLTGQNKLKIHRTNVKNKQAYKTI